MTGTPETITEDELTKALIHGPLHANAPAVLAAEIFGYVRSQREPEYEPGGIYADPAGGAWFRMRGDAEGPDWRFCESGTLYSGIYPNRPLRKLVPLPSVADLELLIASQPAWIGEKNLAAAMHKLLEGDSRD